MKIVLTCFLLLAASLSVAFAQEVTSEQQLELEYFQAFIGGAVFKHGDVDYPEERIHPFTYTFLSYQDSDMGCIYDDPLLRDAIGTPLQQFYDSQRMGIIGFIDGSNEVLISVKIGDVYYGGFRDFSEEVIDRIQQCDRP